MNGNFLFFRKFVRHGTRIASVMPSSRWLAERTVRHIDWQNTDVIVELGAGTGAITEAILAHAKPGCRVIAIERDADFVAHLRKRYEGRSGIEIVHGGANDIAGVLKDRGIGRVQYIVSGLPVPSFPDADARDLFRSVAGILAPDGVYSQITEFPLLYQGFYRQFFNDVRFSFVPLNVPPGGVYYCRSPKPLP